MELSLIQDVFGRFYPFCGGFAAGASALFGASVAAFALSDRIFEPSGDVDGESETVLDRCKRGACVRPIQPSITFRRS